MMGDDDGDGICRRELSGFRTARRKIDGENVNYDNYSIYNFYNNKYEKKSSTINWERAQQWNNGSFDKEAK